VLPYRPHPLLDAPTSPESCTITKTTKTNMNQAEGGLVWAEQTIVGASCGLI
jgi:hypothetical protein